MNYDQFLNKYNNKYVDDDGAYGNQCWDLASRYAKEVVGCPSLPTRPGGNGGARDCFEIFMNPLPQYFDKIANNPNDPNQVPQRGDIIIWGAAMGIWGHIAIVDQVFPGQNKFISFDQNSPVGSKSHLQQHSYFGVLGWLRPKKNNKEDAGIMNDDDAKNLWRLGLHREPENDQVWRGWVGKRFTEGANAFRGSKEWLTQNHMIAFFGTREKQLADANNAIGDLRAQISELNKRPTPEQLKALEDSAKTAQDNLNTVTGDFTKLKQDYDKLKEQQIADQETGNSFLRWLGNLLNGLKKEK